MNKLLSIGELIVDFLPLGFSQTNNPKYEMNCGGSCANVAVSAARFGVSSSFAGSVGDDFFGNFLVDKLDSYGVDTTCVSYVENQDTTLAFVHIDSMGERSFSFIRNPGADTCFKGSDFIEKIMENVDVVHFGGISLSGVTSRVNIMNIAEKAYNMKKIVTYDPNIRQALWSSVDEAKMVMKNCLKMCNVLKVSEEELEFFTDIKDIEKGAEYLHETYSIPIILVTLGKDGVYCKTDFETVRIAGINNIKSVDTTGAGDCFVGAFISQILKYGIDNMRGDTLKQTLIYSNTAAGISTTKKGAIDSLPNNIQVEEFIRMNA